jgi:hypothetical protein
MFTPDEEEISNYRYINGNTGQPYICKIST